VPASQDTGGYRRVLVALDGSPAAEEALPQALAQAHAFAAELLLLRVVPTLLPREPAARDAGVTPVDVEDDPRDENPEERAARLYLTAVAENMRGYDVTVTARVARGPVAATILQEAQDTHADVIVLTTHGSSLIPRLLVGAVTTQVAARAPCPVLLVRPSADAAAAVEEDRVRSFDDDAAHYGPLAQRPLGVRTVELERIVGSVGRARELGPDFLSRRAPRGDTRHNGILRAMQRSEIMPPVELYKLGYDYYVLDGNHRVAAAKALDQREIDATVTEFLSIDDADAHRVYLERRAFERDTGLAQLGATRPGHYPRLQRLIEDFAGTEGMTDLKEAAQRWYTRVYRPFAARLRAARLTRLFPGERTADLFVHLADLREAEERRQGRPVSREEALERMLSRYRSLNPRRRSRRRLPRPRLPRILGGGTETDAGASLSGSA